MMLTLALTGTVAETVDPEAGDVTVTIRLPSCACAWDGIQAKLKIIRAAAQTPFLFFSMNYSFGSWCRLPTYRSTTVWGRPARSWGDVEGIDHDGGPGRGRVLRPRHFDRQRMAPRSQARQREEGRLGYFRSGIRIEGVRNHVSIQDHARDPGLGSAVADPADRRPGEAERGLIARGPRQRGGPLAVWMVAVVQDPTGGISDGRIGLLAACSRRRHFERIHVDNGSRRRRVKTTGHFDRQRMAPVGQARCLEEFRLDRGIMEWARRRIKVRGSIVINLGHEGSIQKYASDPVLGSMSAERADPRTGEAERGSIPRGDRGRGGPAAPWIGRITMNPAAAGEDNRRIRILQARDRRGGHIERIHVDVGKRRGRVLPAGHFDRQRMARVGEAHHREHGYLDFLGR